jgi:choline dehydrogenase
MGATDDQMAVIDPQMQVRGLQGLRVVDSSIFPTVPNGNLNGPTIMVAERAADIIKQQVLPTTDVEVYKDSEWQQRQRCNQAKRDVTC